jgi:hypothetical protein
VVYYAGREDVRYDDNTYFWGVVMSGQMTDDVGELEVRARIAGPAGLDKCPDIG